MLLADDGTPAMGLGGCSSQACATAWPQTGSGGNSNDRHFPGTGPVAQGHTAARKRSGLDQAPLCHPILECPGEPSIGVGGPGMAY